MSSTPGNREVAYRLFAAEFEEASYSYSESDEERAPNYVVTPTGARVNRLFVTGVLTEVAQAGDSILRARVVDPTGAFVVYAGQYQPEAMSFLDDAETPSFVAVTGKARTFQPEDSDLVYTSVRPESVSEVDATTRDRWTVTAARRTLERIGVFAAALETGLTGDTLADALREAGVDASLAAGIPIAIEQYGTTPAYLAALQEVALDAVRLVAGDADEVRDLERSPDEGGDESFTSAIPVDIDVSVGAAGVADAATDVAEESSAPDSGTPEPAAATDEPDATGDAVEEPSSEPVEEGVDADAEPAGDPATEGGASAASAPDETDPDAAEPTGAEETVADAAESVEPDTEFEDSDSTEPVEAVDGDTTDEEPALDSEATASDSEAAASDGEATASDAETDAGAYEMDEETREEVESEFGTDFSTGNEVEPAGEADIDTPEPAEESTETDADAAPEPDEPSFEPTGGDDVEETELAAPAETETEPDVETEPDAAADSEAESEPDAEATADEDLDTVLVEEMKALDDGDGAPRDELVVRVVDRTGASEEEVGDAIQDALMSGQCYEPEDGRLKPI